MSEGIAIIWTVASFMGLMMVFQAKKRETSGLQFGRFEEIMLYISSVCLGAFGVVVGLKMVQPKVSDQFKAINLGILAIQGIIFAVLLTF